MSHGGELVTVSTVGYDPDKAGVGGSPMLGDVFSSALWIPQFRPILDHPIPGNPWWFLFRLCAYAVGAGERVRVVGCRQLLTIAQEQTIGAGAGAYRYVTEREVISPDWRLPDSAVSWHLRKVISAPDLQDAAPDLPLVHPSLSRSMVGTDSAMLIDQYNPATRSYIPPNGGEAPGIGLSDYGTFYNLQFAEKMHFLDDAGLVVDGPCVVAMYAAVLQSDPLTRPFLPVASQPANRGGVRPEDQFVWAWGDPPTNNVRLRHIGASMTLELGRTPRVCT